MLLDEVQKCPSLFDEVKAQVDQRKTPGRYLLTGSVRFSSKRDIRESLTGRILTLELLPLGLAESHQKHLSDAVPLILEGIAKEERLLEKLNDRAWATPKNMNQFLESGGLPGICFHRDPVIHRESMDNHIDTLLGRDLFQVYRSKLSIVRLKELLRLIALTCGQPINKSMLARELSTTVPTIGAHLAAFESLFLIRTHGQGYYMEDQGLASHLCRFDRFTALADLRRKVFAELQQQLHYRFRSDVELSTYVSTSGNAVPFLFKFTGGRRLGFILDEGDRPSNSSLKVATWFRKKFGENSTAVILHLGANASVVNFKTIAIPYTWIY
jgi:predicted AAA+ superfamily ATPase